MIVNSNDRSSFYFLEPNAYLLFSQQKSISKADIEGTNISHTLLPIKGMHVYLRGADIYQSKHDIYSVKYDEVEKYYYWIDKNGLGEAVIYRAAKLSSKVANYEEVINQKDDNIYDIAIDSVNRYIFWSSSKLNSIQVAKIGIWKSYYAVIGYQFAPNSITLDPYKR